MPGVLLTLPVGKFDFDNISWLQNARKKLETFDQIIKKFLTLSKEESTIFHGWKILHTHLLVAMAPTKFSSHVDVRH